MATVVFDTSAAEQFAKLPERIKDRMVKLIERLQLWPNVSGVKHLRGNLAGHCRIRTGDYRLQFRVEADVVTIEQVGHRDGFYE
ncbi:MAG TPA: type II toxin-antitoxin system RelE/ParE family toxin [Pirellulales bacterium]|nr:type II toxin-antitoxin system RelE/ParE family toxin [Pirellulales bacterium]